MAKESKAEFYHKQRLQAESGAEKGDRSAAGTAKKIQAKLGNTGKAKHYADIQQFGRTGAKVAGAIDRASSTAGDVAGLIEGGPSKSVAAMAAKEGSRLFPRAAEGITGLVKKLSGDSVKRGVQATKSVGSKVKSAFIKSPSKTQKAGKAATAAAAGPAAERAKRTLKSVSTKGKIVRTSPSKTTPMKGGVKAKPTGEKMRTLKPETKKMRRFVERQGNKENPPKSSVSRAKKASKKKED